MSDRNGLSSVRRVIERRQQELLRTLWMQGRLSRWELHEQTGLSPNGVGSLVDTMLRAKLIRECPPEPAQVGRPRVPLEIDSSTRHLLGLALVPGRTEITRLGLTGQVLGKPVSKEVSTPSALVKTAASLLADQLDSQTLAIGVTSTGFLDPLHKSVLFSSALPGLGVESLMPIFTTAGDTPAALGNDMHALAARWLLTHRAEEEQDVLLVWFTDGRMGSAVLIDGRPNRGCVTGANELGHTRLPVDTKRCFCGQTGCLERIVSTDFLHRQHQNPTQWMASAPLGDRVAAYDGVTPDPALQRILELLSYALSNAINFLRPHRLVLVSPYTRHAAFENALSSQIRALLLPELADRVKIDSWDQPSAGSAENAGWLAMAELLYSGWGATAHRPTNGAAATAVTAPAVLTAG